MRLRLYFSKYPVAANVLSAGALYGGGDFIAQTAFNHNSSLAYDHKRTARAITYGALVAAPVAYAWYRFLGNMTFGSKTRDTITKVFLDQMIYAPFVAIPLYFTVMKYLENRSELVKDRLREKYWPTLKSTWTVWPPIQLFNFFVVPQHYRLLAVNSFRLGWNCFLSLLNARN